MLALCALRNAIQKYHHSTNWIVSSVPYLQLSQGLMPPQKTKILYVITKSNFGGAQRYVYELAIGLPKDEFDVAVAFGGSGLLKQKLEDAGITTYAIPSFERDINILKEVRAAHELAHIIRNFKPDIVHLNSSKAGGTGALVTRMLRVQKIIFTAHGWPFFEKRNIMWRMVVWILSYMTTLLALKIIVVSEHDLTHARMPFLGHKITMIHTGVGEIDFLERNQARAHLFGEKVRTRHEHNLWLVSTGEHTKNKNLFTLLEAVHMHNLLHDQKLFLTLMSNGEDRTQLERYAQEHSMETQIHFTGFVSDAPQYLKAFDVFVLPSLKEGLPYGLLEAGRAELACVASNVGGIPEIIEHEKNGLLIDPRNVDSIVSSFESLANDAEKCRAFGAALHEKVTTNFSLSKMITETQKLYS